jgi:hypothetical protein
MRPGLRRGEGHRSRRGGVKWSAPRATPPERPARRISPRMAKYKPIRACPGALSGPRTAGASSCWQRGGAPLRCSRRTPLARRAAPAAQAGRCRSSRGIGSARRWAIQPTGHQHGPADSAQAPAVAGAKGLPPTPPPPMAGTSQQASLAATRRQPAFDRTRPLLSLPPPQHQAPALPRRGTTPGDPRSSTRGAPRRAAGQQPRWPAVGGTSPSA